MVKREALSVSSSAGGKLPLYKTKVVEACGALSGEDRRRLIRKCGYNVFMLPARAVAIDLLTDSGTGAMSREQLAGAMLADESYAGSESFFRLRKSIHDNLGRQWHVIPCHQGRGAEHVFNTFFVGNAVKKEKERFISELKSVKRLDALKRDFSDILHGRGLFIPKVFVPGNTHFDTTEGQIRYAGGLPADLVIDEGRRADALHPFKGNVDARKLRSFLMEQQSRFGRKHLADHVPYVLLTVTCNTIGGQPVSMANIDAVKAICREFRVPLFFDMARIFENAYFIKSREKKYRHSSIRDIAKRMLDGSSGALMSAKKEGLAPIGGFIIVRSHRLYEQLIVLNILNEGYRTYGGMSGMAMEIIAQGLREASELSYQHDRHALVSYLHEKLSDAGIPLVKPCGGHAVFVDGRAFYRGVIPEDKFPAQALAANLYELSGVRGVEIGACLKGRDEHGKNIRPHLDLMRLAIPRRVYSREQMDVVVEAMAELHRSRDRARGLEIIPESEPKLGIRHFSVRFRKVC